MPIDFPSDKSINDTYTYNNKTWVWNGEAWELSAATETGNTEGSTGELAYYDVKGSVIKGATGFHYNATTLGISCAGDLYVGGEYVGDATFSNDIKVNDLTIGRGGSNYSTNTALGYSALKYTEGGAIANFNVAVGYQSLLYNTQGADNTATGYRSLFNNISGYGNVAIGYESLYSSTGGHYNIAVGGQSMWYNADGDGNVALGWHALRGDPYEKTTGHYNVAVGNRSLTYNTTGSWNVASGYFSLYSNTTGNNNVAIGRTSLKKNTTGDGNVATGYYTLYENTEGDNNSALGYYAGNNGTTGSNNTYLGHNAQPSYATVSNEIVLGDSNVTLIHSVAGMSMGGGATFGGPVAITGGDLTVAGGNILLQEDGYIGIIGDSEKIIFNGAGPGSSSIDMNVTMVDFGTGAGAYLRSRGDTDTYIKFENDLHGGGNDGIQLVQSGNVMVDVHPTVVNVAGATFGNAGATFGSDVNFQGNILLSDDSFIGVGSNDERIIFDSNGNDITLATNIVYINNKLTHNGNEETYIAFTTDTVSLAAGGTVALEITTAGADFGNNQVLRPKLKDYSETIHAIGTVTGDTDVTVSQGNVQTVTVGGNCEFTFDSWPTTGIAGTVTLIITNGGAYLTVWNDAVYWPGNNAPALTSSGVDIVSFMTIDSGTKIYGFVGGINFSAP